MRINCTHQNKTILFGILKILCVNCLCVHFFRPFMFFHNFALDSSASEGIIKKKIKNKYIFINI